MLFAGITAEIDSKSQWLIACDDEILQLPFAALVTNASGDPAYLLERHATWNVLASDRPARATTRNVSQRFVGIGDGIYNAADDRLPDPGLTKTIVPSSPADGELPRLPGSGAELRMSAAAWGGSPSVLFTGTNATLANFMGALGHGAAVIHLAAHVRHRDHTAAFDLGWGAGRTNQELTARDVAALAVPESVVAMSGCSSGDPGLTAAWLHAGARAVIGTRWSTADDTGALFSSFYPHLRESLSAARHGAAGRAMRTARLEMLHSRSWRSSPAYWASFFVVEKE